MRFVPCMRSWCSFDALPHHLPFDDGFCLPFGIPSQKGGVLLGFETLVEVFVFRRRFFLSLEPMEIRLYLGASLCIYLFDS